MIARFCGLLLTVPLIAAASLAVGTGGPAGAAGILPPANPSANIAPSSNDLLVAINAARAREGVGPMEINEAEFDGLPAYEQLFVAVNLERIDRGLPPIEYLTAQLNADAAAGAAAAGDPAMPASLSGGVPVTSSASLWAGGLSSALAADYFWMYDDGPGSNNATCNSGAAWACWVHRDAILRSYPSCGLSPAIVSMGTAADPGAFPGGSVAGVIASSCSEPADVVLTWPQAFWATSLTRVIGMASVPSGSGYWEAEADGTVANFGTAPAEGSFTGSLNAPIIDIAATPDGGGYWLVGADGGVFSYGDAHFYGSTGSMRLNSPVVALAPTSDGKGYWLVAADGGIFSYGDALFHGSMGGKYLNAPVVGIAPDPATGGYWEVATDGGIFAFDAPFLGSTGNTRLNQPIVGIESTPNGTGYRFEASDGGVFSYGQAVFAGSMGGTPLVAPMAGMAPNGSNGGYWLAAADGGIFSFGGASYYGRIVSSPNS
jgi:hypothetical protein